MGDRARIPELEGYLPLTPAVLDIMVALGDEVLAGGRGVADEVGS